MPLRVHCPNGCLIRMPSNRAGRIVRCPECKASIQLSSVSESESRSGKPIPIEAVLVSGDDECPVIPVDREVEADGDGDSSSSTNSPVNLSDSGGDDHFDEETDSAVLSGITAAIDAARAEQSPPPRETIPLHGDSIADSKTARRETTHQSKLEIPSELSPLGIQKNKEAHRAKLRMILAIPEAPVEAKPITVPPQPKRLRRPQPEVKPPAETEVIQQWELASNSEDSRSWEDRIRKANEDRIVLSRLLAGGLCVLAIVNMIPALIFWYDWYRAVESTALPRWIYLQCFVAALHFVYAIFQFQIPEWSAVRAVSVTMLVVAFVFGVLSTGLLVGGGGGIMAGFLGVSHTYLHRAAIWCVTMLCLATLVSYIGGREAANWQRSQQLLMEINFPS